LRSIAKCWDIFPTLGKGQSDAGCIDLAKNGGFPPLPNIGTPLVRGRASRFDGVWDFREDDMFNMGKIAQGLVAMVFAATLTATAVAAAVGPATSVQAISVGLA
jgi:hypothetical protein